MINVVSGNKIKIIPDKAPSEQTKITYLRISVTDRCNLKCFYCRPENQEFIPRQEILDYEDMVKLVKVLTKFGLKSVRITGGEPLLRQDIEKFVAMLNEVEGIDDISMTTNAITLKKHAKALKEAGLRRLNISIDSLKPELFYEITKGNLQDVIDGIVEAKKLGIEPIKINAVIIKGLNENEALDFVEFGKEYGVEVRFIEMMPIGQGQIKWDEDMVQPLEKVKNMIEEKYGELVPSSSIGSGAARVYEIPSINTKVGFITPLSNPFCDGCSKLRLTVEGSIKLCLRTDDEIIAKDILKNGTEKEIEEFVRKVVVAKEISNQNIQFNNYAFGECQRIMTSIGG
ncbi:GTP 3',8-cyclase MoaA [Hydrogenivirga sp. 128-5-R1-1]|uniref:GTP 3',8-cyclase MoaA n=1 Tax=Hydrogenivirga sp. 128-5-R1-1 TaxID=392423 RepID=UPI00015F26AC|nr:GTP 3',8-cyclase MoaA [Hydrogenivirga sp. 128-5-R1-1]EDP74145.1 molybdenum cofactor synthesis-like protein [Hydrogenivirga sp. 128-5-R1-1]